MNEHQEKIEILRKYYSKIETSYGFDLKGNIRSKKIDNAIKKFAFNLDRTTIIGFYDTTVTGSGKAGYIFTDTKVYYLETMEKPKKIWYDDIKSLEIGKEFKTKDCDKELRFHLIDGTTVIWDSVFLNKTPLYNFFTEIIQFNNIGKMQNNSVANSGVSTNAASIGGTIIGQIETANKTYNEEKFHARQGHGFAAERANDFYDRATGHEAKIVGDDNAKNGADRIVDGIEIQSKYCATGSRCVNECFENDGKGRFRYYSIAGTPMQIEVPSDKYDSAVQAMEEKIRRGQVEGISNPSDAREIVRKGHFTYEQAKNIAKAGTVESIKYDAATGAVIASSALGVSAILSFATAIWNGDDINTALKTATYTGLRVGGSAFITNILASQLTKAGLNSALVKSSEQVTRLIGPKAYTFIANAFRDGSRITGSAAIKSTAKIFRTNAIAAGISLVILSSSDIVNIFRGRISGKQLFKNVVNTGSSIAGGTAGWAGGALVGTAILPGVGTVVGGLIGSIGGGMAAGKASNAVVGAFIEDDAEEMVHLIEKEFSKLATEYLLNQKEAEKVVDRLRDRLEGKILKNMYAANDRLQFANNLLIPLIEREISMRDVVYAPSVYQMNTSLRSVLEELSENSTFEIT